MRTLLPIVAGIYSAIAATSVLAQAQGVTHRKIPILIESQPMRDALNEWAQQTGLQLVFERKGQLTAPKVNGMLTAQAALEQLLAGTSLTYVWSNETVAVYDRSASMQGTALNKPETIRLAAAPPAPVQNASIDAGDDTLYTVVVTAQRREQSIKEVPLSITALGSEQLATARISNALDLSFAVPGLAVAETGPGRQIIVIRGLGSERGSSSLTGVYLDEMPVTGAQDGFNQSYIDLRALDLERVEVLKGPQGTLFGEGSVGGTLRYITKDPELDEFGGSLSTSLYTTSDGGASKEIVAIANLPVATDVFGLRIAATYEDKAGWIDRPTTGQEDINDNEVAHVRVKGLWQPTADLAIKAMIAVHRNDGGGSNIVNQGPRSDSNFVQALAFNGSTWDRNAPTDFEDDYELYNLNATYNLGFAELLSSTSYADIGSVQSFTQVLGELPEPTLEVLFRDYIQNATIASQEFRLTSLGEGPLNWTVGAFYKDAEITREWRSGYDLVSRVFTPPLELTGVTAGSAPTSTSESIATYADVSYGLTEKLRIGGGLRYFYDERESFDASAKATTLQSGDFDAVTFRVYGSYNITDDVHLYVNIGDGARSGGFNSPAYIVLGAPETYEPESVLSYEGGIKTLLFDRRLSFDAAVFFSKYQDMQDDIIATSPVDGVSQIQFTTNGQEAELKGFEWDASWRATDSLTLAFSGDVIDTEITKADPTSPFNLGDPINFVPEYSLVASAHMTFDWASWGEGFFQVDFNRKGESVQTVRRSAIIDPPQAVAPPVSFVNASIGMEVNDWQLILFGRNLTDEDGIIRAGVTGQTAQARPRTFGITLSKSF